MKNDFFPDLPTVWLGGHRLIEATISFLLISFYLFIYLFIISTRPMIIFEGTKNRLKNSISYIGYPIIQVQCMTFLLFSSREFVQYMTLV